MDDTPLSPQEIRLAHERGLVAIHVQALAGNPFDSEDRALFDMFERERWSHEKCIAYIIELAKKGSARE